MALAAPLPELTEYERDVVKLWRKGCYVHQIRKELGGDNWRIAGLLERLGLKEKTKERNHTKRPDDVRARALERYQECNPDGRAKYNETAIALEAGLKSTTTLRTWVEQAGIPLRRPEDRGKMGKRVLTPAERAEIVRRHHKARSRSSRGGAPYRAHHGNRQLQNAAQEEARATTSWLACGSPTCQPGDRRAARPVGRVREPAREATRLAGALARLEVTAGRGLRSRQNSDMRAIFRINPRGLQMPRMSGRLMKSPPATPQKPSRWPPSAAVFLPTPLTVPAALKMLG